MDVVAHINRQYFVSSETFIYFYLTNFQKIHPLCLGWWPFINQAQFPFPNEDCYVIGIWRRRPLRWLATQLLRCLTGRYFRIERLLQSRNVRLIHAHYGPVGWASLRLKRNAGVPLVTNFYGYDMAPEIELEGGNWPRHRQELFAAGDLFLVEGPFMRRRLIELGCPPERVQVQRVAIRVGATPFRPRAAQAGRRPVIVFAGRFCEKKGLAYALQAVAELAHAGRAFEFRLIGDGPLMPDIQAFVREQQLESWVSLLGFLNHRQYLAEMDRADLYLHPSVTASDGDTEGGAPTVILEAQASGLPVVSTFHADIPHVVVPDKSAVLVPERDAPALALALGELLDHPERWEAMGRAGRAFVEDHHDIVSEVGRLEEKYFTLLGRSGMGRHDSLDDPAVS